MSARTADAMIARALEMDERLLAVAPALLGDLEALGGEPDMVADILASLGVAEDAEVVDLGAGKGATALAVAQRLGCRVVGVDLFGPFVEHANRRARELGLYPRASFRLASVTDPPPDPPTADVAIFSAMGDVLGPLDEAMTVLRRWVRPGGLIVVDDSVLTDAAAARIAGFEQYADRAQTRQRLQAHGDVVVAEHEPPQDDDDDEAQALRARAEALAAEHPHLADLLLEFAADQEAEYAYLAEDTTPVIWVIQRATP